MTFEEYCGSKFFIEDVVWNTTKPDLTECMYNSVVIWVPLIFVLIIGPFWLRMLIQHPFGHIKINATHQMRFCIILLIIVLEFMLLIRNSINTDISSIVYDLNGNSTYYSMMEKRIDANIVNPTLNIIILIFVGVIMNVERLNGRRTSGFQLLFWFLFSLGTILKFQHNLRIEKELNRVPDMYNFISESLIFPLSLVMFIWTWFLDEHPDEYLRKEVERKQKREELESFNKSVTESEQYKRHIDQLVFHHECAEPCPEPYVSIINRVLFWWITPLMMKGYKTTLDRKEFWAVPPSNQTDHVVSKFEKNWNNYLRENNVDIIKASRELEEQKKELLENKEEEEVMNNGNGPTIIFKSGKEEVKVNGMNKGKKLGFFSKLFNGKKQKEKMKKEEDIIFPQYTHISIFRPLLKSFGQKMLAGSFFKLLQDILLFVSPMLLKALIRFTKDPQQQSWIGYSYSALLFLTAFSQTLFLHQYFHRSLTTGLRFRTAIIGIIYRKTLRLNSTAKNSSTVGEIVNLMSVDAQRFYDIVTYINMIWSAPFQIIVAIYFLWQLLGPSVLAGVGIMILLIPMNAYFAQKQRSCQITMMKEKDKRIKVMNEILNGIKVIKLYAWENSFMKKVRSIRDLELKILRKVGYISAASTVLWFSAPFIVTIVTFATYVLSDRENHILDSEKAFVALSLFNILRFPMSMLPMVVTMIVQAQVSLKRVNKFLMLPELDPDTISNEKDEKFAVNVKDCSFTWQHPSNPVIKDANFAIPHGSLVAIIGQVGSGKSSLISSLLGETFRVNGKCNVDGRISYVSQLPWIQNATIKQNIIFLNDFNKDRYDNVIERCALTPDLEILDCGDETEIGEKGINLSGGQKQRLSIARATYADSDIYIFDDPLSAVDAHVGKHIFDQVIGPNSFLKDKTRILSTNAIWLLPQCDYIMMLENSEIIENGEYKELVKKKGRFARYIRQHLIEDIHSTNQNEEIDEEDDKKDLKKLEEFMELPDEMLEDCGLDKKTVDQIHSMKRKTFDRLTSHTSLKQKSIEKEEAEKKRSIKKTKGKLIEKEDMKLGSVSKKVIITYLKSVGPFMCLSIIFCYTMTNGSNMGGNIWLSEWSNNAEDEVNNTSKLAMRLGVYATFGVIEAIFILAQSILIIIGTICAASLLHTLLLESVLKWSLTLFEATPSGRILNRFTKDIDAVDGTIPASLRMFLMTVLKVLSTMIVIAIKIPFILIVILPLGIIFFFVQRFYVTTSRQLKRLESVTRSPIYSHFSETVNGTSIIKAFKANKDFIRTNAVLVDENQMCDYPNISSNRWLAIRLEFVGNCVILFASLFAVIQRDSSATLTPGGVGLAITYAMNITQTLNWMVRMSAELETNIVAVERIKEYSDMPPEADWKIEDKTPPPDWPQNGEIHMDHYSVRYRKGLDLVLKNIDINIKSKEKIGIVGRTGAGKSSLTLSLFRILEAAEGRIKIDGIDISKIGLHDLREKLTIIPQDPIIFSGTIRENLDPFDNSNDEQLWNSLESAHLKNFVKTLPEGLDFRCTEGGENLSVGQRQLFCLARALLRKTKILILDEATAAIDVETDGWIQQTIRTEFDDCSVLTIAHRLNTIMDSTRVLVMDKGQVAEFDTPENLLKNQKSIFYSMAKNSGLVS
ncbi:hypothetical protein SNEBB_000827 [Seison nebaliae]|nr:hypothetical protein SNEBB_000827 [Seison nebaliae]